MKVVCIVSSAGRGKRLGLRKDKPFVLLGKRPILEHTLKVLNKNKFIDKIVLVVSRSRINTSKKLVKKYNLNKVTDIIQGGRRRFDSVRNGLRKIKDADIILIHDGVRPFVDDALIKRVILSASKFKAAVPAIPSKQTIKRIDRRFFVKKTPDRKFLWEAQTPQGFQRDLILKAYKKSKDKNPTDDSSLVEKMGHRVKIVKGAYKNLKITTREDLNIAKVYINKK